MAKRKTTDLNNHNTFSGLIFASDFYTDYDGTRSVAGRIASDLRFDEQCRRNELMRERMRKNAK